MKNKFSNPELQQVSIPLGDLCKPLAKSFYMNVVLFLPLVQHRKHNDRKRLQAAGQALRYSRTREKPTLIPERSCIWTFSMTLGRPRRTHRSWLNNGLYFRLIQLGLSGSHISNEDSVRRSEDRRRDTHTMDRPSM